MPHWLIGLTVLLVLFVVVITALAPRTRDWSAEPRRIGGALVFQEHFSVTPASVYSREERENLSAQIDPIRFLLPHKLLEIAKIFTFESAAAAGEPAPDFELRTTAGDLLRISDLRGKPAVFMFAAMTCPPARAQVPRLEALQHKYGDQVTFFLVYSRERHPGEKGFPAFEYAETDTEKRHYAQMLAEVTSLAVAVDGIDEHVLGLYGPVPNSAYVIDSDGTIIFRSTWADSRKVEQVLDRLLAFERGVEGGVVSGGA